MSRPAKPLTLARVNDLTLGAFSRVPPSETLDHLIRYLSTWSGSDKLFMIIQYGAKFLIPILQLRARLQHRAGLRKDPVSAAAPALAKLASIISDARTLWGLWGILPILQWLIALERSPSPTRRLLTLERAQGWSMLAFYPLNNLYYFLANDIIPSSIPLPSLPLSRSSQAEPALPSSKTSKSEPNRSVKLDAGALSVWSTRFWAIYVFLQLAHLREDRLLLLQRQRALSREKVKGPEHAELNRRWDAWWNELAVNLGYLPLTIHWSLETGLFKNDLWVSTFGLFAGLASFRSGWKATALPPMSGPPPLTETDVQTEDEKVIPAVAQEPAAEGSANI
ncbi:hypothetical protein DENSPDRAFT_843142 [Dentipellis sp. KUC8613]|nr:hypothetical protein DENSPDRAFT_843142 [Dentipellis sp. KUC8613]